MDGVGSLGDWVAVAIAFTSLLLFMVVEWDKMVIAGKRFARFASSFRQQEYLLAYLAGSSVLGLLIAFFPNDISSGFWLLAKLFAIGALIVLVWFVIDTREPESQSLEDTVGTVLFIPLGFLMSFCLIIIPIFIIPGLAVVILAPRITGILPSLGAGMIVGAAYAGIVYVVIWLFSSPENK